MSSHHSSIKKLKKTSKYLSWVLRHHPNKIGLKLDKNGWADVNELLEKSEAFGVKIDMKLLNEDVQHNSKKRFTFNKDRKKIRASQGH